LILDTLFSTIEDKGAAHVVLLDPDRKYEDSIKKRVENANLSGVDALFVGGSLIMDLNCTERVKKIKSISNIPVILFPGGIGQLNSHYDAMLFMSVISGRNPHYLIGEQVLAAPLVKDMDIETIPTGYILMDGGAGSTVEFISGTRPIPMDRIDIVVAHALAGQFLGMRLIYLEAGSGAKEPVSTSVIEAVSSAIDVPIIVGGGINNPELARSAVEAGASIIVTGTIIEDNPDYMKEFADAIHIR
jgi:putative glycerol-1-phosphate prenyltransferase